MRSEVSSQRSKPGTAALSESSVVEAPDAPGAGVATRADLAALYDPARHRIRLSLGNAIPLTLYHLGAVCVFLVGFSWPAAAAFFIVYWTMIFGVSAGYHRLLAHRSFQTHRWFRFLLAFLGAMSAQMGPLWWSAHHRQHHHFSEQPPDVHSPVVWGFWWSHIGWMFDEQHERADLRYVPDLARYPELAWLDRFRYVPPLCLALLMVGVGALLAQVRPEWGASSVQMLVWGFFLSTTVMYHVTFCVNSVAHILGARPFETGDNSRNLVWLALLTNGEGWHNNHHRCPSSERHGIHWWQLDMTHAILRVLERVGIVWDIRTHPQSVIDEAKQRRSC